MGGRQGRNGGGGERARTLHVRAASLLEASDTTAPPRPLGRMWSLVGAVLLGWMIAMSPKRTRAPGARIGLKRPAAARGGDKEGSDDEPDEGARDPRAKPRATKSAPPKPPETLSQSEAAEGAEEQHEEAAEAGSAPDVKEEAGSPSKYTPKGVARRDYAEGNRMLAGLRAQKTGKDPEKAAKAAEALDLYGKLGWEEKESMVSRFRSRPAGGGTKWIDDWMEHRKKDDATSVGYNENWRGPGQVLQLLGMGIRDFDDKEKAQEFVTEEVRRNQEKHGTLESHPPRIDDQNWLMSRYFWVVDNGTTRKVAPPPPPRPPWAEGGAPSLGRGWSERGRE